MYTTTSCPENEIDILKRSKAINCTEENPYMCLPNKDRTDIFEICHHEGNKGLSPGKKTDTNITHVQVFHVCLSSKLLIYILFQMQVYVFIWIHATTLALVCTNVYILRKDVQQHGMNHMHVSFKFHKVDSKITESLLWSITIYYYGNVSVICCVSSVISLHLFQLLGQYLPNLNMFSTCRN